MISAQQEEKRMHCDASFQSTVGFDSSGDLLIFLLDQSSSLLQRMTRTAPGLPRMPL